MKTLGEDLEGPAGQGPATAGTLQGDCKAPSTERLNLTLTLSLTWTQTWKACRQLKLAAATVSLFCGELSSI